MLTDHRDYDWLDQRRIPTNSQPAIARDLARLTCCAGS
jgi:hypothetical protein